MLLDIFKNQLTLKSDKWLPYFESYEEHLGKFVGKSPVVVEIGVQGGGSLQMWRKYFGDGAVIHGIDIDESVLAHKKYYDENIHLHIGNQSHSWFWDDFLTKVPKIDILIDDGGHGMVEQRMTLDRVFPHINEGGVFICEDTHTSYYEDYGAGILSRGSFMEHCKGMVDVMHINHIKNHRLGNIEIAEMCSKIKSMTFVDSMVIIHKGTKTPFNRIIVNEK